MKAIKTLVLISAIFAAQSAMADTYDLGEMGPPGAKSVVTNAVDTSVNNFNDYFTFSINDTAATTFGNAPDVKVKLDGLVNKINVTNVILYSYNTADGIGYGDKVLGDLDGNKESFLFTNLAAGSYYFKVVGKIINPSDTNLSYTFSLATTAATAVPEPEQYAMMLAGIGLVGFAARRKIK